MPSLTRYAVIKEKYPREIVLLRGRGCFWKQCRFCDYHKDSSPNEAESYAINNEALSQVTGCYGILEVVNSGSFPELDTATMMRIREVCREKNIRQIHLEAHWRYVPFLELAREAFAEDGVRVKFKIGVESFVHAYREGLLNKGMGEVTPQEIARHFDEICLLVGFPGQTRLSMRKDILKGLRYFERVCVNVMTPCSASLQPHHAVIQRFLTTIYHEFKNHPSVDILLTNTAWGIGVPDASVTT